MARRARRASGAVRQLPSGNWQARLWNEQAGTYTTLGTFASKRDADATLRVAQTDKARGDWIDPKKGRVTFGSYSAEWLGDRTDLGPRTAELYRGILKNHLRPAFGTAALDAIDPVMVRRWFSAISKEGPGAATAAKSYRLLRTIMGRAVTEGLIVRNPVNVERAGKENAAERPTLTIAQVYALADAIGPRFRPLVVLAAFTGLRLGELRGLRQGNLDLYGRTVRVVEQVQEGGQSVGRYVTAPKTTAGLRTVAIPEAVIAELEAHLATVEHRGADEFVFAGYERGGAHVRQVSGVPFSKGHFYKQWHEAVRAVGLGSLGLHFHDLRHTGNTLAAGTGASTRELMARLGHASPQAALRYQHASRERDQAIAASLDEKIRLLHRGTSA